MPYVPTNWRVQYSQHYFDSEYYRILNMTSTVCAALGKSEKHMQKEAFEKTIMPIRVWAEEDYPRLIRVSPKMHIPEVAYVV